MRERLPYVVRAVYVHRNRERKDRHLHRRRGARVGDAAMMSGLSDPGRLHDLCVKLESTSPGERKSGGEGWTITAGEAESLAKTTNFTIEDR